MKQPLKKTNPPTSTISSSSDTFWLFWQIICICLLIRFGVSLYPHSGENNPPKFGDYEAQRHWMEITTALPLSDWYNQTVDNDLEYWGLDYPPLTAYHSWVCGKISSWLDPKSMELHHSHGYSTPFHRVFMRVTSIVSEVLILWSAILFYVLKCNKSNNSMFQLAYLLSIPSLILIDHGHFQYNAVCLGLFQWSLNFIFIKRDLLGAICFTLALNFKQIALYYAPSFFFYFLGKYLYDNNKRVSIPQYITKVLILGATVIFTFLLCWSPFIFNGIDSTKQVLNRIFPVGRGLYEDKVANFWCSISPLIKFKELYSIPQLIRICAISTAIGFIPASFILLKKSTFKNLVYHSVISSFSFFLFAFHVHEKSVLFPLFALSVLSTMDAEEDGNSDGSSKKGESGNSDGNSTMVKKKMKGSSAKGNKKDGGGNRDENSTKGNKKGGSVLFLGVWMNVVGAFSLYPLIEKEGQTIAYFALLGLFILLTERVHNYNLYLMISLSGMAIIHTLSLTVTPPPKLPHLFVIAFTTFSFIQLLGAFFWLQYSFWSIFMDQKTKAE